MARMMKHTVPPLSSPAPDQSAEAPKKPAMSVCIAKSGQVIVRGETLGEEPRKTLYMPLNINQDPRMFVKNGEIVRPFVTFEFKFRRTVEVSGIDVSLYQEVGMKEFDPTDMVLIGMRSLEKDFNELNAA
jgi:hypothetical protein